MKLQIHKCKIHVRSKSKQNSQSVSISHISQAPAPMQLFLSDRPAQTPSTLVKVGQIQIHENTNEIIFREGGFVIKSPSPSIILNILVFTETGCSYST